MERISMAEGSGRHRGIARLAGTQAARVLAGVCLLLGLAPAMAAQTPPDAAPVPPAPVVEQQTGAHPPGQSCPQRDGDTSRPRIGVALGGGGARGVAHISVLRKLEELKIPVDCIAGTSMGSLVGGLYAAGVSIEDMEALVLETDWKRLFDDTIPREERSYRRKQDDRDSVATLGVGLNKGKLEVSPGMLQGERILSMFERRTLTVSTVSDFDKLPIPFRATGTDLNTGRVVEIGHGSLAQAMRASMSLPGIFQPVVIDGHVLIDGGIAEQVPVDTVRRMGADIVIAVDVGTPLTVLDEDASLLQVISQLTGMLTVGNTRTSVGALREADVLIVPELGSVVATGDFAKAKEALAIGDQAAAAATGRLAALPRYRAQPPAPFKAPPTPVVEFVRLDNHSRYSDEVLTAIIDVPVGRPVNPEELEDATLRAYSQGTFASVTYEVVEEDGRTGVVVTAREKPQGPNYVQAGFLLQTDFSGTYESSLRVALLRSPVTEYGAEARILAALGSQAGLWGEYYHPFDPQARWYFYGRAGLQNRTTPLFNDDGDRIATYDTLVSEARLSLGRTFGLFGAAELGVQRSESRSDLEVGNPALPDLEVGTGAWFGFVSIDRLDSLYFPRSGYSARLDYRTTASWLGGEAEFEEAGLDVLGAVPFGRHAVQYGASYQTTLSGVLPLYERYSMGGRGRLVGFHFNELTGQNYAVVTLGYSYQLASFFGRSAVVGSTLEYGNAWNLRRDMDWSDGIFNGSAYVGFDSWIGPMLFGYGMREGGEGVMFLEIGKPF
ncbi:patatin-like phospholipase family protein [Pseudoxanthomonas daejeonensis]|uniref:patatin-like phospholipase family protein n=1 Tax=Pseudoxanthomonas daejeonensis TaxID=266062 RepID=UPI001F5403A9|nr:patatin-like phospholipase family protein [Pseudoxanthomonas daejeonensis]UNK57884.1 patatin-like phospholipase family protein [Pseudoxanthomonas daejeonensis]